MVKRIIVLIIIILVANTPVMAQTVIKDPYEGGNKYGDIRPYEITKTKSVTILENGAWSGGSSSDETRQECKKFRLKHRDVREFFRYARRVSYQTYHTYLSASNCYASGKVTFANRDSGAWYIDAFARGSLSLPDGRNLYFYCTKCTAKVFYNE